MASPNDRTRILFVCLGNICRSPTAEVVFRAAARRAGLGGLVTVESAGTGDWHVGNPPDYRAIEHAAHRGYDLSMLRARQFKMADFDRYHWILPMDRSVFRDLDAMRPAHFVGQLRLFLDLAPQLGVHDVPDPYDEGPAGFELTLDLIEQGSAAFAATLAQSLQR
ncbi:MAG: low molecular weight protein-tyrosine-phosphatase [Betaproteobacteria bacterium]